MSYQNTVIVGNVGWIGDKRFTPSGKEVINFNVAVNERYGDTERTTWFRVAAWNGLGGVVAEHVSVGQTLVISGPVRAEAYTDREGNPAASLALTARTLKFVGPKPESDQAPAALEEDSTEHIPL